MTIFEFVSKGPRGSIHKLIKFEETNTRGVFNLAFGDVTAIRVEISDSVISRLYRMGITKFLKEIMKDYDLYGQKQEEWEIFKKGTEYAAFLVQRKNA